MNDDDDLAELVEEIQNGDLVETLAREMRRREALEKLVISMADRLNALEYRERLRHMFEGGCHD